MMERNRMDKMQQAEILGKLFSAEGRALEHAKSPVIAGPCSWDHWSAPVLLERVAYLQKLARFGDGTASEELKSFPGHCAILSVRLRSGMAEVNEEFAQLFIVLEGRATLADGRIEGTGHAKAGQIKNSVFENGSKHELRAGDVVHIAAGTSYRILLAGDTTLSCLVIRITEIKEL
jgi:mannose-6-phosphate isomerase-like protein (cupin superfamily)